MEQKEKQLQEAAERLTALQILNKILPDRYRKWVDYKKLLKCMNVYISQEKAYWGKTESEYTKDDGLKVVEFVASNGIKEAYLIGSLSKGLTSKNDIDILLPKNTLSDKTTLIDLFKPKNIFPTDWGGLYFEGTKFGNVDIFFEYPNSKEEEISRLKKELEDKDSKLKESVKYLNVVSPLMDVLINITSSGALRNRYCDINFELKQLLKTLNRP